MNKTKSTAFRDVLKGGRAPGEGTGGMASRFQRWRIPWLECRRSGWQGEELSWDVSDRGGCVSRSWKCGLKLYCLARIPRRPFTPATRLAGGTWGKGSPRCLHVIPCTMESGPSSCDWERVSMYSAKLVLDVELSTQ